MSAQQVREFCEITGATDAVAKQMLAQSGNVEVRDSLLNMLVTLP